MTRFDGRVAALTGAASGIGRATAIRLAAEGATVVGLDIDEAGLAGTTEAAGSMDAIVCDVADRAACHAAVEQVVADHGRLDVFGNIAGVARSQHVPDVTEQDWDQMVAVNLSGVFWCAQAAIPHLLKVDGVLINIASNAGLMGQAYTVPYCATKGAVVNMTRALAMEYAKTGLRVNAIAPGAVQTPLVDNYQLPEEIDFSLMAGYIGLREMSRPEDIAAFFAFLASDEARQLHGAILSVDAGLTAGLTGRGRAATVRGMEGLYVLGVDLDGVCGDYTSAFRSVVADELGIEEEQLPLERSWDFTEWNLTPEDFERLHLIAVADHRILRTMPVIEDAAEALWRLSDAGSGSGSSRTGST